jgi:hypothetical protein
MDGRRKAGFLIFTFLFGLYCLNVGWYRDLNATDCDQEENFNDLKETDRSVKKAHPRASFDSIGLTECGPTLLRIVSCRYSSSRQVVVSPRIPSEFSLTSRPPPVL